MKTAVILRPAYGQGILRPYFILSSQLTAERGLFACGQRFFDTGENK